VVFWCDMQVFLGDILNVPRCYAYVPPSLLSSLGAMVVVADDTQYSAELILSRHLQLHVHQEGIGSREST
jgi:hypothetical protein